VCHDRDFEKQEEGARVTKAESIEKVSLTKYFNKKETAGIVENVFGLIKSTLEDGDCFLTTHDI
jgi:hypothetical protein